MSPSPAAADARPKTLHYLPGLDGLRAISILAVMVYHQYAVGGHEVGWMPGGYLGVEVFFVVSGYLITSLLLAERRQTGTVSLKQFWFRRGRRLLPALWVLLAVVVAYSLLFLPDAIGKLRGDVLAALTYTSNWWQIVAHRSYFAEAGRPSLLKHLWSLAIEEQFYLIWPPLLLLALRRWSRNRVLSIVIIVALLSTIEMWLLSHGSFDRAYYGTDTRLSGLLLGSAFAFVFAPYRIRGKPGRSARVTLDVGAVVGLLVLLWCFRHFTDSDPAVFRGGFLLVDLATLLVVAAAVHPAADAGKALGVTPLRWIGLRSYSLYLWHYPIFAITRPDLDFRHFFHLAGWPVWVLRLVLSFGAADLSYRYIETPIRNGAVSRYLARARSSTGVARTRMATRAILTATSLTVVALLLTVGLANAQPQNEKVFGVDSSAHHDQHGEKPDAAALSHLLAGTSTTTISSATSTSRAGTGATTHPTTPTTHAPPPRVLGVGDSVMLGAKSSLEAAIPGIVVDAKVSRQFGQAIDVLTFYRNTGLLPPVVVVHLGTNGRITDSLFDQMMQTIGARQVFFLTARVPRPWEAEVNDTLHRGAQRWKNAHILEWRDFAGSHDDWFAPDGFHVTRAGAAAYAAFVRDGISKLP